MIERFAGGEAFEFQEKTLFTGREVKEANTRKLQELANHSLFSQMCEKEGVTPFFPDKSSPYFFFRSARQDSNSLQIVQAPLFGFNNLAGVAVLDDTREKSQEKFIRIMQGLANPINNGNIAVLKPEDISEWTEFYNAIQSQGHYERIGDVAFELSGLTRSTPEYYARLRKSIVRLVIQNYELALMPYGVENISYENGMLSWKGFKEEVSKDAFLDAPFLRADRQTVVLVPLAHLRTAELQGCILIERVEEGLSLVPGFVVVRIGENKREAYERAKKAQSYYQNILGRQQNRRVIVPVISTGQISLWRKLGFSDILRSAVREDSINQLEAEELVRFLFLGNDNSRRACLAEIGYSLPGNLTNLSNSLLNNHGVDIFFYKKNAEGQPVLTPLPYPMYGWDLKAREKGNYKTKLIGNVIGLIAIPSNWSAEEIRRHSKGVENYIQKHTFSHARVLCVDRELLDEWKNLGTAIALGEILSGPFDEYNGRPTKRAKNLTRNSGDVQFYYVRFQRKAAVGGAKTAIVEVTGGNLSYNMINFGAEFGIEGEAREQVTGKPSTALGLRPGFESGKYPMIPGVYELQYLVQTALNFNRICFRDDNDYVASFLRAEIYHRMGHSDIENIFPQEIAQKILEYGPYDERLWYRGVDSSLRSIVIPHAHADHFGDKPVLDHNALEVVSVETWAFEKAADAFGRTWQDKQTYTLDIASPMIGSAYRAQLRPFFLIYYNGQEVHLSESLVYNPYFADHSIPGNLMQYFCLKGEKGGGIVYTSDVRIGGFGQTEFAIQSLAGLPNTIVVETTNPPDSTKPSVGKSEGDVLKSLKYVFKRHPNSLIVVAAPKNHVERLSVILEAANNAGRQVAADYKRLLVNESRKFAHSQAPLAADGLNYPIFSMNEIALWAKTQKDPMPYQETLYQMASDSNLGVVDERRLSEEGDKWVVVVSPHEFLDYLFGGTYLPEGIVYVYCSYYPYQRHDKLIVADNYQWVGRKGGLFYGDFIVDKKNKSIKPTIRDDQLTFHVSGHASFAQMLEKVLLPLLDGKYKGKQIVLEHGASPDVWKRAFLASLKPDKLIENELSEQESILRKKLGLDKPSQLGIYSHLPGYKPKYPIIDDPKDPIGITGFKLPIF